MNNMPKLGFVEAVELNLNVMKMTDVIYLSLHRTNKQVNQQEIQQETAKNIKEKEFHESCYNIEQIQEENEEQDKDYVTNRNTKRKDKKDDKPSMMTFVLNEHLCEIMKAKHHHVDVTNSSLVHL